jgi:hypothetical protein
MPVAALLWPRILKKEAIEINYSREKTILLQDSGEAQDSERHIEGHVPQIPRLSNRPVL